MTDTENVDLSILRELNGSGGGSSRTPVLTSHARERCVEMGISTKVAKLIWRNWSVRRELVGQHGRVIVTSHVEPAYALIMDDQGDVPVIITVMFNVCDVYVREGRTYRVVSQVSGAGSDHG